MPLFARLFLGALLFVALFVCIVVPLVLSFWQIYSAPARNVPTKPALKELLGTLLGILAADPLLYVLYRSTLPKHVFYLALVALNGFCLAFVCYGFVAWWLYQMALRNAPSALLESDTAVAMRTSSI